MIKARRKMLSEESVGVGNWGRGDGGGGETVVRTAEEWKTDWGS